MSISLHNSVQLCKAHGRVAPQLAPFYVTEWPNERSGRLGTTSLTLRAACTHSPTPIPLSQSWQTEPPGLTGMWETPGELRSVPEPAKEAWSSLCYVQTGQIL